MAGQGKAVSYRTPPGSQCQPVWAPPTAAPSGFPTAAGAPARRQSPAHKPEVIRAVFGGQSTFMAHSPCVTMSRHTHCSTQHCTPRCTDRHHMCIQYTGTAGATPFSPDGGPGGEGVSLACSALLAWLSTASDSAGRPGMTRSAIRSDMRNTKTRRQTVNGRQKDNERLCITGFTWRQGLEHAQRPGRR